MRSMELLEVMGSIRDKYILEAEALRNHTAPVKEFRPRVSAILNITEDHLVRHHTMENYYQAKKLLFGMCEKAVINLDDPTGCRLLEEVDCPCVTFSTSNNAADYTANDIQPSQLGSNFAVVGMGVISRVKLAMPGDFSVSNAMAAISCCVGLGLELEDVCRSGCIGERLLALCTERGRALRAVRLLNAGDGIVKHGEVHQLRAGLGLDAAGVVSAVLSMLDETEGVS